MSDRDDAPPGPDDLHALFRALQHYRVNEGRDVIPAAARWRLAAWIVAGLEPTREMVEAGRRAPWKYDVEGNPYEDYGNIIAAALAAAREAGDGA